MLKTTEDVLTAVVAPFTTIGSLSVPALKMQTNRQLEAGNTIFCDGINDEFFVLSEQEKLSVTQTCVGEVVGRTPAVAHIGEISTRETARPGQWTKRLGVDAVSVIALYFVPLEQEELITHYSAITDALSIPALLYNIPVRAGNTVQPETTRTLVSYPNIIRIKDSAGDDENLKGFLDAVYDIGGLNVLNGPDSLTHKGFVKGRSARISRLANIAPREINAIRPRFHAGGIEGPYEAQESVTGLYTDLYKVAFSPVVVKKALQLTGYDAGNSRYAANFTPEQISEIQQVIRHYNIS